MIPIRLVPFVLGVLSLVACHAVSAPTSSPGSEAEAGTRTEAGLRDVSVHLPGDAARADGNPAGGSDSEAGAADDPGSPLDLVPGWSVRKRVRPSSRQDVLLEERLVSLSAASPGATRLRRVAEGGATGRTWSVTSGESISDFCVHPSGELSAVVVATDRTVSVVRLSPDLEPLGTSPIRDSSVGSDPGADAGALDLFVSPFTWDGARIGGVGEDVVTAVSTSRNSVVAYRSTFDGGAWSEPRRTLVEPPVVLIPFLPTSGSFDTFGAITVWFRVNLDVDEDGNTYVAVWANADRVGAHRAMFGDGAMPVSGDPDPVGLGSDVLVTKLDRRGDRIWSRVVGTIHGDEPYAIRARFGVIAVVGRARRFPGLDNTAWDALLSVLTTNGDLVGTRAVPLDASGIFLAADVTPGGGLVVGGSDGWSQNPNGLSVVSFGRKLLLAMPAFDGPEAILPLSQGPRHNEVRSVLADAAHVWFGGHEDGPIMHTGDADPMLIHATGVSGFLERF